MEAFAVMIGAVMLVIGGIAAAVRVLVPRPKRAQPAPKPADPAAEARAVEHADTVIDQAADEVERIDATESDADRTRRAGSRLRR